VSRYREQVARALRAIAVRSPDSYAWFGRTFRPAPRALTLAFGPGQRREYLISLLEMELYRSFYTRGMPVPYRADQVLPERPHGAFVEMLSACNRGRGGWQAGWRVQADDGPTLQLVREGLRVSVPPSDCRREVNAALVSVRRPNEDRVISPGFYFALGDADWAVEGEPTEVRVYLHLTAAGAAPLVASATDLLNEAALPFSLKVVNHPAAYSRCDAAVVYLRKRDFAAAQAPLRAIVAACAPHLRPHPPPFTKPLSRGVGVAEHLTSQGASFGTSRCRLLAEGVVAAHEARVSDLADRLAGVARCFASRGLDVDAPYLASGSSNGYEL
jgi:hypothetical protein